MRVFTKINGELACWEVSPELTCLQAIDVVKRELGPSHKNPVLVLVKY